ncbi:MAG: hypothetical protein CSA05_01740 [Bacteroidia bacterium]|nr:MAG: hypothetical protein CSA05_01740 [Bacteroidia bacterium]
MKYSQNILYDLILNDKKIFDFTQNYAEDGIWLWHSEQAEIIRINPLLNKRLGYQKNEPENRIKLTYNIIADEDLYKLTNEYYKGKNLDDRLPDIKLTFIKKDKTKLLTTSKTIVAKKHNEKGFFLIACVSISKDLLGDLSIKQDLLKEAQIIAKLGNWEYEFATNKLRWSEGLLRIFEADKIQFEGNANSFFRYIHPDDLKKIRAIFTESLNEEQQQPQNLRIISKKNKIKHIELRWKIKRDKNNKAIRAIGTIQDITEQKKLEIAEIKNRKKFEFLSQTAIELIGLDKESEILDYIGEKLQQLIPDTLISIFYIDTKKRQGKIHSLRSSIKQVLNIIYNTIKIDILNTVFNLHPDYLQQYSPVQIEEFDINAFNALKKNFSYVMLKKLQESIEIKKIYTIGLYDDTTLYAGIMIFTLKEINLKNNYFIELFIKQSTKALQEIIDKKKIKQAKNEAEKANKIKAEFIANMSHEFRTPMNAILGFSEILKNKLTKFPQYTEYFNNIMSSGKSLLALINDILDLSKIEAGKLQISSVSFSLPRLIDEIKDIFKLKAKQKGIQITAEIAEDFPQYIFADESRMRQVLFNLVGNAIKFTDKGFVSITLKEYTETNSKVDFKIRIKDSGIGIHKEQLKIIFEPFRQQANQDHGKYQGTGLGLAISERLISAMNGKIHVKSTVGKGSEFIIAMKETPIQSQQKQIASDNNESIKFNPATMIVADDLKVMRRVVTAYLDEFNFKIIEAEDGEEIIDIIKKEKVDLIFTDLLMPKMNGEEAAKFIKNEMKGNIPICAITTTSSRQRDLSIFDAILQKPINKELIVACLKKFIPFNYSRPNKEKEENDMIKNYQINKKIVLREEHKLLLAKIKEKKKQIQNFFSIDDVLIFTDSIDELAKFYKIESLHTYTDEIRKAAQSFDIEKTNSLLLHFDETETFLTKNDHE